MEWNTAILTKTYGYIKVAILRTFEYEKTSVGFNYKVFLQKYSNKLSMKALVEKDILMKKQG